MNHTDTHMERLAKDSPLKQSQEDTICLLLMCGERNGNWITDKKGRTYQLVTGTVTQYHVLRRESVRQMTAPKDNGFF